MCLLGIFLVVCASIYNPVRSVFLRVNWVCVEVEASEVQRRTMYSVPYIGTDAYASLDVSMSHESLGMCNEGAGGTYEAGVFRLDWKGFREA
eukprot:15438773-Alexandrium_andersonii.AAC.1